MSVRIRIGEGEGRVLAHESQPADMIHKSHSLSDLLHIRPFSQAGRVAKDPGLVQQNKRILATKVHRG